MWRYGDVEKKTAAADPHIPTSPHHRISKIPLLFLVILIEGYVVLACELLAIRQLIPFVGSGTDVISIIISAVLLPLAIGYHAGGQAFRKHWQNARARGTKPVSIRVLLLRNIVCALFVLTLGLSYSLMEIYFSLMAAAGLHRLMQTVIYVLAFLVWPVFLLGQTVPLISNYFSRQKLSEITGRMLFFSTTGSFLGSVFSTLVLMSFVGVHNTVIITLGLLCFLALLLARRRTSTVGILCSAAIIFALTLLNGPEAMKTLHIVENNAYNTVSIHALKNDEALVLNINRSASSKYSKDPDKGFPYIRYIEQIFIEPVAQFGGAPRDILVLGAGGFTLGYRDNHNRYTYVDIDPDLKETAEKYFLPAPIGDNKKFVPASARAFVHNDAAQYDLIVIDLYTNVFSIPMEAVTRDFLLDVKKRLKPEGVVAVNIVTDPGFGDRFSIRYHNTFANVFPIHTRQVINGYYPWADSRPKDRGAPLNNVLYMYFHKDAVDDRTLYTDDKNTYSLDRN